MEAAYLADAAADRLFFLRDDMEPFSRSNSSTSESEDFGMVDCGMDVDPMDGLVPVLEDPLDVCDLGDYDFLSSVDSVLSDHSSPCKFKPAAELVVPQDVSASPRAASPTPAKESGKGGKGRRKRARSTSPAAGGSMCKTVKSTGACKKKSPKKGKLAAAAAQQAAAFVAAQRNKKVHTDVARLEKNRQSARDCRLRKKHYIRGLEEQVRLCEMREEERDREIEMLRVQLAELREQHTSLLTRVGCNSSSELLGVRL